MNIRAKICFTIFLLLAGFISFSQTIVTPPKPDTSITKRDTSRSKADTVKEFEIIRGPSMRSIHIDSVTTLQTIAGGAIVKQGTTIFNADSIAINPNTHIVEAFGNVHINQADSVQTYAQYLKYIGTDKTAFLKKDVKLQDKKSTIFTKELDYNLGTGIGNYHNGGKVINGKTIITSQDGTYYADTKDVYFKNNVVVNEPKNHITTDSLLYNMKSQASNYTGTTHITNKEFDIYTTQGTYDFNTGNALFTSRTTIIDSNNRVYTANRMALDNKSGDAQLEGNAIVKDSAGGYIVFANQIFSHKKNNSFLATRKPVLIIKQKNDSIYIAADTIFSGYSTAVKNEDFIVKNDSLSNDSLHKKMMADTLQIADTSRKNQLPKLKNERDSSYHLAHLIDSLNTQRRNIKEENFQKEKAIFSDSLRLMHLKKDSIKPDSVKSIFKEKDIGKRDSLRLQKSDTSKAGILHLQKKDGPGMPDTSQLRKGNVAEMPDTLHRQRKDTTITLDSLELQKKDTISGPDSSRYFLAFHHVRIYSDSLQSVCDSLFFSTKDSVFRLYYSPIIWSGHTQVTGDTIFLFTKNKKVERFYTFEKGMIVNKTAQGFYNQISGKTINGYFVDGSINYMRVKGSQSESIYYAQDNDSAYLGMNRATGDVIDFYFKKDDLKKVLFVNDVKGKFYPMRKIPADQKLLKDFIWLDDKRPKNKLELFE
ncbi:MAG: LPS export ABC transporter periplasmic protein LptC [Bacteroidota bacterium]|nr:LPS export ABC transporter periplasmic protein LptC [Bacteroidota bacterium]